MDLTDIFFGERPGFSQGIEPGWWATGFFPCGDPTTFLLPPPSISIWILGLPPPSPFPFPSWLQR